MTKFLAIMLVPILFISCSNNDDNDVSCDALTVISEAFYKNGPKQYVEIKNAIIIDNCLMINFASSGCDGNTWELTLVDSEAVAESEPVQRFVRLALKNEEACLAFIDSSMSFDLTPLLKETNEFIINLEGWDAHMLVSN